MGINVKEVERSALLITAHARYFFFLRLVFPGKLCCALVNIKHYNALAIFLVFAFKGLEKYQHANRLYGTDCRKSTYYD